MALALSQMNYLDSFRVWAHIATTPPTSVKGCQSFTVDDAEPSTVNKLFWWLDQWRDSRIQMIYVLPHSVYVR